MTASTPYYMRVAAKSNAFLSAGSSTVNLSIITAPTPVANDYCANATVAVVGAGLGGLRTTVRDQDAESTATTHEPGPVVDIPPRGSEEDRPRLENLMGWSGIGGE